MIMILDVDVTAERRHYNAHRPQGDTTTLGAKGPVKLKNPPAVRPVNPKNLFLHNPSTQPAAVRRPQPSGRSPVNPHVRILHRMRKSAEVGP